MDKTFPQSIMHPVVSQQSPNLVSNTLDQLARVLENRIRLNKMLLNNQRRNPNKQMNHIFDNNGKRQTLEVLLKGPGSNIWQRSTSNEFGRLAQGNQFGIQGTDTLEFPKTTYHKMQK